MGLECPWGPSCRHSAARLSSDIQDQQKLPACSQGVLGVDERTDDMGQAHSHPAKCTDRHPRSPIRAAPPVIPSCWNSLPGLLAGPTFVLRANSRPQAISSGITTLRGMSMFMQVTTSVPSLATSARVSGRTSRLVTELNHSSSIARTEATSLPASVHLSHVVSSRRS